MTSSCRPVKLSLRASGSRGDSATAMRSDRATVDSFPLCWPGRVWQSGRQRSRRPSGPNVAQLGSEEARAPYPEGLSGSFPAPNTSSAVGPQRKSPNTSPAQSTRGNRRALRRHRQARRIAGRQFVLRFRRFRTWRQSCCVAEAKCGDRSSASDSSVVRGERGQASFRRPGFG